MSAVKQLDAGEVSLAKIFCSDYDFKIPDYQRPYSWKREQTLQLLDDLDDALDREQDEPYFLGSIVLVKSKGSPEADVIDGQQRLTTLTILFSVLRHLAEDQELANELNAVILEPGSRLAGTQAKPRLRLRPRDADFFERWIQRPGRLNELIALPDSEATTDARRAIRDNTKALLERLETWDDARRERLAAMMGSRTFLVVVSTPDLASAHRIFSVMNARGLDLTAADIFKATVIGSLPDSDQSEYADRVLSAGLNVYFSFAGNLTYRNARNLHETVSMLPYDRILVESEAPFMVPAEYRGKRNKPEYLPSTAWFLSEILQMDPEEAAEMTYQNACRFFKLEP
mgnify:CR=1 FL=1